MTPVIALLVIGGILLKAGWTGDNIVDVVLGRSTPKPADPQGNVTVATGVTGRGKGPLVTGKGDSPLAVVGKLIGLPFQGTHAKAFNVAGGSDNWQSENAVDIATPVGTPVYAVTSGTIGPNIGSLGIGGRFAGQRLTLTGGGNSFFYQHLSQLVVRAGQKVKAGQLLGYSGSANGVAHLHFATESGDPRAYLP